MPEIGIEEEGFETGEKSKNKRLGNYCSIAGLDYSYYEEIVESVFERSGLPEHIPKIEKAGNQKTAIVQGIRI